MTELSLLVDEDDLTVIPESPPQGRCDQCRKVYGRERPEHASALRCPNCDYPFGETLDGVRTIALALQGPKRESFTNVYAQPACYIWLWLVRDGIDLHVEPFPADSFGVEPDWFAFEFEQTDWSSILGAEWCSSMESDFAGRWNNWGLEQGLMPKQAFLVELKPPHWSRCGGEYEEYDVEYYWDIVSRERRTPAQAARAWDQWRACCIRNRQLVRAARDRAQRVREHDVKAMYIRLDAFLTSRACSDDPPDGYIVRLCSTHGGSTLLEGRSPANWDDKEPGSRDRAWAALIEQAAAKLPHLDLETLRKLPTRF